MTGPGPVDGCPPPASRASSPRSEWRRGVRWFAAEFLVVVTGILVALALNAWWSVRADQADERAYLRQLASDLEQTERLVLALDSASRPADRAGARLVRTIYAADLSLRDSVFALFRKSYRYEAPSPPVLATAEALLATGDLNLVRDASLRAAIVAYVERSRASSREHERFVNHWMDGSDLASSRVAYTTVLLQTSHAASIDSLARSDEYFYLPAGRRRDPFPVSAVELLSDRQFYEGILSMHVAKRNLRGLRVQDREEARALRARVEAELSR